MKKYILKRVLISIVILFFVSMVIYGIMRCIPTSFVEKMAMERAQMPGSKSYSDWLEQLNALYGMDGNIVTGFFNWLGKAIQGDFGDSWKFTVPVVDKFKQVIWDSFWLAFITLILRVVIAIPLGILSARKQYSKTDYAVTVFALIGISLPTFFFATILKLVFSINLGWLDLFGKVGRNYMQLDAWGQALDVAKHYIMPVLTLTIVSVGDLMRYTRTNMLEVLNSDFIRTARAKGLAKRSVNVKHALRNAMLPVSTVIGLQLGSLLGGALLTETVFAWPGIGKFAVDCVLKSDFPVVQGVVLLVAVIFVFMNLLVDIIYAWLDPRIKYGAKEEG